MSAAFLELLEPLRALPMSAVLWLVLAIELFALASAPSVLLRRRGRPVSALAWLLALFAAPVLGGVAWWLFGRTRLERKKLQHSETKREFADRREVPTSIEGTVFDSLFPARARERSAFASQGNRVSLLADGEAFFLEFERCLQASRVCIHIEMYIFELDATGERILALLTERARAGVTVRLLLDGFGSQATAKTIKKRLAAAGSEVSVFLPSKLSLFHAPRINFINHRKVIIIDDTLAFTGGMNIGEDYRSSWRDLMLKIEGPAVRNLHHVFLEDWYFATGTALDEPVNPAPISGGSTLGVVASGPDTEPWIHDAMFLAITRAQSSLVIATPYFIPSLPLVTALRTAAGRGVKVSILVPSVSDVALVKWASRSYYRDLVVTGVRIFEYRGRMLHAKALLSDKQMASVGTANIDSRSLGLSFEVSCFSTDPNVASELDGWLSALTQDAEEISLDSINRKGVLPKLAESAAHLLSPLL